MRARCAEHGDAVTTYDLTHAMTYAVLLDAEAHEICWEDAVEMLTADNGVDRGSMDERP